MLISLARPEQSHIDVEIIKFPDGQQSIKILKPNSLFRDEPLTISTRLNNFQDVELLCCLVAAIRNVVPDKKIKLWVPYLLGSRSDRKFEEGGVNYLKQVIAPIINSLKFYSVEVMDPHSDVIEGVIDNVICHSNFQLVMEAFAVHTHREDRVAIVAPDAGSLKKIFKLVNTINDTHSFVHAITSIHTASKVRQLSTGRILKTELYTTAPLNDADHLFIIDDICDGGRTFIELAKVIREKGYEEKLHLIVTHGIFSKGLQVVKDHFDSISTTDSYQDFSLDSNEIFIKEVM